MERNVMENNMALGERLQALRKSRGLSQEQLAEQAGVSRQAVSKWELGESVPELRDYGLPFKRQRNKGRP